VQHKTDLKVNDELFVGITGLNTVFDNPDNVTGAGIVQSV
jgi:hypothetical protein